MVPRVLLLLAGRGLTISLTASSLVPRPAHAHARAGSASAPPSICLNATGFAAVSIAGCPAGTTPFRHVGADASNLLWNVWTPTHVPHPPWHIGNWQGWISFAHKYFMYRKSNPDILNKWSLSAIPPVYVHKVRYHRHV